MRKAMKNRLANYINGYQYYIASNVKHRKELYKRGHYYVIHDKYVCTRCGSNEFHTMDCYGWDYNNGFYILSYMHHTGITIKNIDEWFEETNILFGNLYAEMYNMLHYKKIYINATLKFLSNIADNNCWELTHTIK